MSGSWNSSPLRDRISGETTAPWVLARMSQERIIRPTIIDQLDARNGYVSSTEAITILGISRQTFCLWVRSRKLTALRIGNAYMIDPAHLAAFLRARLV
jgi:excisionase family DNA binding protein